ncbi:NADH dehydrogenase subunit E [Pelagimonas phthalicica]|uniref:NADH dehydrogenase subunit E n=1 Tax=Pelagimonas phthalicica TaxID=1037362 RepID=A0A238JD62_9RHOB|nr:hypothetical protein [Pelagimonas phthalicica]TDS91500.1 putative flap endonuclease-1-like 5' DNA nuclease [Pelagimonas phthalicica]SMX28549.1 NADH dehydrogenase subunit E [Pelagimonas phthalicica]
MNNASDGQGCRIKCWTVAGAIGLFVALMAIAVAGKGIIAGIFLGLLAAILLGLLFIWLFCADVPAIGASGSKDDGAASARAGGAGTSSAPVAAGAAAGVAAGAAASAAKPSGAEAKAAESDAAAVDTTAEDAVASTDAAAEDGAADADAVVKPSTVLEGEAELAERKGSWKYERDAADADGSGTADAGGNDSAGDAGVADAGGDDAAADAPSAEAGQAAADAATAGGTDDAEASDTASAEPVIKPSTALAGEAELAERKGTWKYEAPAAEADTQSAASDSKDASDSSSDSAAADAPTEEAAAEAVVAAAPVSEDAPKAAASDDLGEDYDRDGVKEGTEEGSRPSLLEAPREGGPDNLKEIKGIGPKLEKVCHSLGIYHFDQIAAWSEDEVAWANANLVGFKGRVSRDNWVEQAKILAAGGETEFSKRVDKGGVY